MKVAVPRETFPGERRTSLVPDAVSRLVKQGFEVLVEHDAGAASFYTDAAYESAGARIVGEAHALCQEADLLVRVQRPSHEEVEWVREGAALVSFLQPHLDLDLIRRCVDRKLTYFSMDLVPRITKAQDMDALSSMSTLAGYKAVLLAATAQAKMFPMLVSAAGTLPPSLVLVLGAGVAGLQAIATARRLGARVQAFDIRPATKEQVQSLGARFVDMDLGNESTEDAGGYARELSQDAQTRALETIRAQVKKMDVVICTALIPGKPAPRLILEDMVREMKRGAVIVDLAAEAGGNCELTRAGEDVEHNGVTILGPRNLPSTVPTHASQMYARNVSKFLGHVVQEGELQLDFEDPITGAMCVTHGGEVRHEGTRKLLEEQS